MRLPEVCAGQLAVVRRRSYERGRCWAIRYRSTTLMRLPRWRSRPDNDKDNN